MEMVQYHAQNPSELIQINWQLPVTAVSAWPGDCITLNADELNYGGAALNTPQTDK